MKHPADSPSAPRSQTWMLRAIVWFAAASMLTTVLHELAHATTAFALGVRGTLFGYAVDLDFTGAQRSGSLPAIIGVAGPAFCLLFGIVSWWVFRRTRDGVAALPLLFLAAFGIATFFGNLMSIAFVGDFSRVAADLHLPMVARYGGTAIGILGVAGIEFWLGRQLMHWVPANVGRVAGVLGIVVLPVLVGTAAVMLAHQPMSGSFVTARLGEASFALFAVIGAFMVPSDSRGGRRALPLHWADGAVLVAVVLVARLMASGMPFAP